MECGAGERPGIAWRNFRTSISFGCSPHVWEGTPQGFVPRLSEWRFTYSLASRHVAFLCGTLPHVIAAQMFWRYLRSIPFFLRCEGMRLTSAHLGVRSAASSLGLFLSVDLSDSSLRGSPGGLTTDNNAWGFIEEDIDWGAGGWKKQSVRLNEADDEKVE